MFRWIQSWIFDSMQNVGLDDETTQECSPFENLRFVWIELRKLEDLFEGEVVPANEGDVDNKNNNNICLIL